MDNFDTKPHLPLVLQCNVHIWRVFAAMHTSFLTSFTEVDMGMLLQQGLMLMVIGMTVTYGFLFLLVLCTRWMSAGVQRFWPSETNSPTRAPKEGEGADYLPVAGLPDSATLHIIREAIELHRKRSRH